MGTFLILTKRVIAAFLMLCSITVSAGTLSQLPLSLKSGVPPNIMFALSVEFPTAITPAYQDASGYSRTNTYLGYFDPTKCYWYNAIPSAGNTGYFMPWYFAGSSSGSTWSWPAVAGQTPNACVSGWSGNFLNWASMAGLDEFRYAMTGGNRTTDLSNASYPGGLTILERSYQTSQGGNFITKTYTDDNFTANYGTGSRLTITNNGQGVQMAISLSGVPTDNATCTTPGVTHGCDGTGAFTLANTGGTATCSAWTGAGTSASPYNCSTMIGPGVVISSITQTAGAISNLVAGTATSGTVTANCTGMYSGSPSCTFTLSDGTTGTCSTWAGTGTSSSPYTCTAFSNFSSNSFSVTSPLSPATCTTNCSTFIASTSTSYTNSGVTCTVTGSGSGSTSWTTTCISTDGTNTTGTCSAGAYAGTGSSSTPYYCNTLSVATPTGDTFTSISSSTSVSKGSPTSKKFYTVYSFTNNVPGTTTNYYTTTYTGSYSSSAIYYYSGYSVTYGTSDIYNVRVQVCATYLGVESNCTLYSDGATWKPTGVLQNNTNMRFGVTSYFNANDIDNAVLRAKAKYLSPQSYLSAGTFTPNLRKEWLDTDGTLVNNPDSSDTATMTTPWGTAPANSGVINYINKFGTVSGALGQGYKTYDDISKLYYETLKYLRGGNYTNATSPPTGGFTPAPTTAFYNGAKSTNNDGFPVITTWDDPIQYSCQKNYIITMGDAHTWCDKRLPGGTYTSNGSGTCNAYTDGNGNSHPSDLGSLSGDTGITGKINGTTIPAATGTAAATNAMAAIEGMGTIATTQTGAGGASYYMAGLATWAATNNIRPDLAASTNPMNVKSFVIDVQESVDCSYRGDFWLTAKYGDPGYYSSSGMWNTAASWYNSIPGNSISCSSNSPPNYGSTTLSMNWPRNLLRAGNPVSMIDAVKTAIATIAAEQGDEAALAQSAGSLNTGTGAYIYQAGYNSGGWTGDVNAFVIDQTGSVSSTPDWYASKMLPNPANRNVFTFRRDTMAGTRFAPDTTASTSTTIASNFDTYEQGFLNNDNAGHTDNLGADRVRYILGDMSKEAYLPSSTGATTSNTLANNGWRSRKAEGVATTYTTASFTNGPTGQLGDVIDSSPLFLGPPSSPIPDGTYKTFALAYANRTPMVYVGGNDGMLHAYNASYSVPSTGGSPIHTASTGTEVFAYVPYAVYPTLSNLMSPSYTHTFYVDGSPISGDVWVNSGPPSSCSGCWKTILVGGMNAGGQGVYALDITDPIATDTITTGFSTPGFTTSNVLWEFTNLDDSDLGYTFNIEMDKLTTPNIVKLNNGRWAVIFGNGFNSVDPTGNPNNNNAYLFILYVDPGLSSTSGWVQNTNYFKIALTSPGTPNNASNGLAGVAGVDVDGNGTVDYVYAGDRNGNMWKIDLTSSTPSAWGASFSGTPLFSAFDGASTPHRQQITTTPKVANNPNGGYMVMFGTGSWIDTADTNAQSGSNFYTDTLYGIWDQNTGLTSSPATGRSVLQRQAIIGEGFFDSTGTACTSGAAGCATYTVQSACAPNYTTTATTMNAWGTTTAPNNLCPQFVPVPQSNGVYTAGSTSTGLLGSPAGTAEQFGWFFDMPGNGERTRSNPPSLYGSDIQFTSLTPSTNPCAGNTSGFTYNFSYLTGGNPSLPIYIVPPSTITPPSPTMPFPYYSGNSTVGSGLNPLTFNATPSSSAPSSVQAACGAIPIPSGCAIGACAQTGSNPYIPGWGFLMNLNNGPSTSTSGKCVLSCMPPEIGGGLPVCSWQMKTGQYGRLSWKQVN